MIIIRKWFINFSDNLTDLTSHSSSNFYYQIVSAQSIQRNKLCLTSLMSMSSAITLSIINPIYHHLFTICTTKTFQREINASGEPTTQVILTGMLQEVLPLGQRGATRDKSPGLKSNRLYHNRVSLMIPQCSLTCSTLP